MEILIGLLVFVGVYVVSKFLLEKVASLAPIAEVLAIVIGVAVVLSGNYFLR